MDLERSLALYVGFLGMEFLRRRDYPEGKFTLAFVGYGPESEQAAIELTHNWRPFAFVQNPDGYKIELIQRKASAPARG